MKPIRLLALLLGLGLWAALPAPNAPAASYNFSQVLVASTNLAANSTNATLGSPIVFTVDQAPVSATLFIRGSGNGATTNGGLSVYLQRSRTGTNEWENPLLAPLTAAKVQVDSLGTSSNAASAVDLTEWFRIPGVKGIRIGPVINGFTEPVSNFWVGAEVKVER